ncbi:hypothetical protein SDC9_121466 [bioreactor metagenome]|uniref:DUF721 domain-containing protein n=1 Tax=bioreactor metagenome TaxID=1076179 RepID=A0A645CC65_9ZZZZ
MKTIATVLSEFATENEIKDEFIFAQLLEIWKNHFPLSMQKNIQLVLYKNNILFMQSESSAWKQEVQLRLNEIINILNTKIGTKLVYKINI